MIKIQPRHRDDIHFLVMVEQIVGGLLELHAPKKVFLVHVKNWFDQKWLNYSGIGRVPFFGLVSETALGEFRQQKIVFPPFTPNRILFGNCHQLTLNQGYQEMPTKHAVLQRILASSCPNLHRRIVNFSDSAIFVWFSSNTQITHRGSVMTYTVRNSKTTTWYASFMRQDQWQLYKTKGIRKEDFEMLFPCITV